MTPTPTIFAQQHPVPRLGRLPRLIGLLLAIGSLAVLIIGARLSPDPAGTGTHTQLGLAPCGLMKNAGLPCMTCGMTTSYALMLEGRPLASFINQPMGAVFCFATALMFWAGAYVAITGLPGMPWLNRYPTTRQVVVTIVLLIIAWGYKIVDVVSR